LRLLYFAWIRERIGLAEEIVEPPATVGTVDDLLGWLRGRGDGYGRALAEPGVVRVALDQLHADHAAPIAGVREVALFPPMTGG
jgi:molybdopterin synthase sulfur carrier subunit